MAQKISFAGRALLACSVSAALGVGAPTMAQPLPGLTLDQIASGFSNPVALIQDPSNIAVQYVVQQRGRIRVLVGGTVQPDDFLNISAKVNQTVSEGGLLGLAFPDDYGAEGRFYVCYTNPANSQSIVARYQRDPKDPLKADPNSEEILLTVGQPFSNHNGGNIAFGIDGLLYIGLGDGGSGGDPGHRSQNPNTLLGKMLRIDVSPQGGYAIPKDNPFVGGDPIQALHEIWAFGVRNPWRWSFDNWRLGGTGAMLMGDVGQTTREEINFEQPLDGGRNYGWRNREGTVVHNNSVPPAYLPLIDPIHDYAWGATGRCVTGGYVYRGDRLGSIYRGRYFYADYVSNRVWSFALNQTGNGSISNLVEHTAALGGTGFLGSLPSFGEDSEGELYLLSFNGTVRRIAPTETTDLVSVEVIFGNQVAGDVESLRRVDGDRYEVDSIFGFSATEPNITEIEVVAQTTATSPTLLDVIIRARLNSAGGQGFLRMFNYNANEFRDKGQYSIGLDEVTIRLDARSNPDRFVSGTGEVRLRSKHVVVATFAATGFRSSYDMIRVVVRD